MQELRIVEDELVNGGDFVGFRLSDDTAILLSAADIVSLDLPTFIVLPNEETPPT